MNPDIEPILATARDLFIRVVYTHETHERERIIWSKRVSLLNNWNVVLAVITTILAVISVSIPAPLALILTAVSAGATTGLTLWQAFSDAAGKEMQHRIAAKELLWSREQLLLLIADCHVSTAEPAFLRRNLEMINRELTAVYKFAANTSPEAYKEAEASIKSGHFAASDDEIDALLPEQFRKKKPGT